MSIFKRLLNLYLILYTLYTLVFVLPSFLCFYECVEDLSAGIHSTEHIIPSSDPLEKLLSCVVARPVVRDVGKVHPHWFYGIVPLEFKVNLYYMLSYICLLIPYLNPWSLHHFSLFAWQAC